MYFARELIQALSRLVLLNHDLSHLLFPTMEDSLITFKTVERFPVIPLPLCNGLKLRKPPEKLFSSFMTFRVSVQLPAHQHLV